MTRRTKLAIGAALAVTLGMNAGAWAAVAHEDTGLKIGYRRTSGIEWNAAPSLTIKRCDEGPEFWPENVVLVVQRYDAADDRLVLRCEFTG